MQVAGTAKHTCLLDIYVALREVTWCMVVWCTQNAPRWQQFLVAPAMPVLVHHFGGYSETRYKKLFTHVESHASAVSLLNSGEQRYIKAISNTSGTPLSFTTNKF